MKILRAVFRNAMAFALSAIVFQVKIHAEDVNTRASYHFDESTGTNIIDACGAWNGTTQNGVTRVVCSPLGVGSSLSFDGIDDYVSIPAGMLTNLPQGTFEAYIWVDTGGGPIISKGDVVLTDFILDVGADGTLTAHMGNLYLSSLSKVPLRTWTKVAITWDGTFWKIYINGSLDVQAATTETPLNRENEVQIGRHVNGIGQTFFYHGQIDEPRVSTVARTFVDADTRALYHFDESTGTNAIDSSVSGLWNGALQNGAARTNFSPFGESGSLSLDGIDDYVSISPGMLNDLPQGKLEAYIWVESFVPNFGSPIVSKGDTTLTDIVLGVTSNSIAVAGGQSLDGLTVPATIPLRTWTKVAVSWDGTTRRLYVDDALVGQDSSPFAPPNDSVNAVQIGRHNHSQGPSYFHGLIEEVRISKSPEPSLTIRRMVRVAWPLWATNFVPQITASLTSPVCWKVVTNTPAVIDNQFTLTLEIIDQNYFRLSKP